MLELDDMSRLDVIGAAAMAFGVLLSPALAFAEDSAPHLANGLKLLHDKNYNGAIAELEAAYRDKPAAAPLLGIAEASHALHDDARASEALKTALAKFGANMTPAQRSSVQSELASVSASLPAAPPSPPPTPESVAPIAVAAPPPPPMMVEERRSMPMVITGISLAGAGLVAAVVGVAIVAEANAGILGQCGGQTCDPSQQRTGGWILAGVGVAGIGVGIPLLVIGARKVTVQPGAPAAMVGSSIAATF